MDVKIDKNDISQFLWLQGIIEDEILHFLSEKWKSELLEREKEYKSWLFSQKYKDFICPVWKEEESRFAVVNVSSGKAQDYYSFSPIDREQITYTFNRANKKFVVTYKSLIHFPKEENVFRKTKISYYSDYYYQDYSYTHESIEFSLDEILNLFR